jgi:hypothetical protein
MQFSGLKFPTRDGNVKCVASLSLVLPPLKRYGDEKAERIEFVISQGKQE